MSRYLQSETLQLLCYAFFHSIISYGIIAWGCAYKANLGLLQKFQNRLFKIIDRCEIPDNKPFTLVQLFAFESLMNI